MCNDTINVNENFQTHAVSSRTRKLITIIGMWITDNIYGVSASKKSWLRDVPHTPSSAVVHKYVPEFNRLSLWLRSFPASNRHWKVFHWETET